MAGGEDQRRRARVSSYQPAGHPLESALRRRLVRCEGAERRTGKRRRRGCLRACAARAPVRAADRRRGRGGRPRLGDAGRGVAPAGQAGRPGRAVALARGACPQRLPALETRPPTPGHRTGGALRRGAGGDRIRLVLGGGPGDETESPALIQALGRVAVAYSRLDGYLRFAVALVCGQTLALRLVAANGLEASKRLEAFLAAYKLREPNEDLQADATEVVAAIESALRRRHDLAHGLWT